MEINGDNIKSDCKLTAEAKIVIVVYTAWLIDSARRLVSFLRHLRLPEECLSFPRHLEWVYRNRNNNNGSGLGRTNWLSGWSLDWKWSPWIQRCKGWYSSWPYLRSTGLNSFTCSGGWRLLFALIHLARKWATTTTATTCGSVAESIGESGGRSKLKIKAETRSLLKVFVGQVRLHAANKWPNGTTQRRHTSRESDMFCDKINGYFGGINGTMTDVQLWSNSWPALVSFQVSCGCRSKHVCLDLHADYETEGFPSRVVVLQQAAATLYGGKTGSRSYDTERIDISQLVVVVVVIGWDEMVSMLSTFWCCKSSRWNDEQSVDARGDWITATPSNQITPVAGEKVDSNNLLLLLLFGQPEKQPTQQVEHQTYTNSLNQGIFLASHCSVNLVRSSTCSLFLDLFIPANGSQNWLKLPR